MAADVHESERLESDAAVYREFLRDVGRADSDVGAGIVDDRVSDAHSGSSELREIVRRSTSADGSSDAD